MKKIILISSFLLSTTIFAASADYRCNIRSYDFDLSLTGDRSTHIRVKEYHSTIFQAYAGTVEKNSSLTAFTFYPALTGPMKITFKTDDVFIMPEQLTAKVNGTVNGFILSGFLNCTKR